MAYSDQLILPTIERLALCKTAATATEISQASGVALRTVKRRIAELERCGVIRRKRLGRRWGSYYEIVVTELPTV